MDREQEEEEEDESKYVLYCILRNILLVYICLWFCCMLLYTTVMSVSTLHWCLQCTCYPSQQITFTVEHCIEM